MADEPGTAKGAERPRFSIFRYSDGREPVEAGAMTMTPPKEEELGFIGAVMEAGIMDGSDTRLLFSGHGMTLVHAWFKRDFPLPVHTHDHDCLYYVAAGSLRLGTEMLHAGDGFFLPGGTPYTYTAGEQGVEVVEFRTSETFDLRGRTTPAFWAKALATTQARHAEWLDAKRPDSAGGYRERETAPHDQQ